MIEQAAYQSCLHEKKICAYDFNLTFPCLVMAVDMCQLKPRLPNQSGCFSRYLIWKNLMARSMNRRVDVSSGNVIASCLASSWSIEPIMCAYKMPKGCCRKTTRLHTPPTCPPHPRSKTEENKIINPDQVTGSCIANQLHIKWASFDNVMLNFVQY